jgi:hypothetical protein
MRKHVRVGLGEDTESPEGDGQPNTGQQEADGAAGERRGRYSPRAGAGSAGDTDRG